MSGGVDSAVAAARAVDAGHDVTGVHLALSAQPGDAAPRCARLLHARGRQRRAPISRCTRHPLLRMGSRRAVPCRRDRRLRRRVRRGPHPNPCLRCNEKIKFSAVLDRALALGFDAVVTGHHARLVDGRLLRSVDPAKDQSYVLAVLTRAQLDHAIFPLGDSTKTQVRAEAAARGLAVAAKPDSHDICFIADGDTRGFLPASSASSPGRSSTPRAARSSAPTTARSASPSGSDAGST